MTTVRNIRDVDVDFEGVYIGRGTKWGNPFRITPTLSREMAIKLFKGHLIAHPELCRDARRELAGKVLLCHCAPNPCHGDLLARVANGGSI